MLGIGLAAEYLVGCLFSVTAINSLVRFPLWAILLGTAVFVAGMLVAASRTTAEPGERVEGTPNECWKLGLLYFNLADSALFVEKRSGIGYTLNFGNPWSWLVISGLVLSLGLGIALL